MNLIPFALDKKTRALVDIAEVESGRKCNCICPSCELALIAKKGEEIAWHFAHDSKFTTEEQRLECLYSWHSAVKLMIKQLLLNGNELKLPEYTLLLERNVSPTTITNEKTINYDNVILDNTVFDAVVLIKDKKIGVTFQKTINNQSHYDKSSVDGIIEFDINKLSPDSTDFSSFKEFLQYVITNMTRAKSWLYHVREESILEKHRADLESLKVKYDSSISVPDKIDLVAREYFLRDSDTTASKPTFRQKKVNYYCVRCEHKYEGEIRGLNACPKCNSHLYRTVTN